MNGVAVQETALAVAARAAASERSLRNTIAASESGSSPVSGSIALILEEVGLSNCWNYMCIWRTPQARYQISEDMRTIDSS